MQAKPPRIVALFGGFGGDENLFGEFGGKRNLFATRFVSKAAEGSEISDDSELSGKSGDVGENA